MDRVSEWRVHIGVHKTATTHMQDLLAANRERIAGAGVDCVPTLAARRAAFPLIGRPGRLAWVRGLRFAPRFEAALSAHRLGPGTLLVSDENLLGYASGGLSLAPYPEAARRLRSIATLGTRERPVRVFLSLRSFETFYASAYAEALLWDPRARERMARLREDLSRGIPSWMPLVEAATVCAPRVELRIWPYEIYRERSLDIAREVIGRPVPGLEDVPVPTATVTPSAEVIAEIEALPPAVSFEAWRDGVSAIRAAHEPGTGSRYRAFGEDERRRLGEAYASEMAELRARNPELFLDPGN